MTDRTWHGAWQRNRGTPARCLHEADVNDQLAAQSVGSASQPPGNRKDRGAGGLTLRPWALRMRTISALFVA